MTTETLFKVGGEPDEVSLALCFYGEALIPEDVSLALGVTPSSAWRRGEVFGRVVTPRLNGAWFLELRASHPISLSDLIGRLRDALGPEIDWALLNQRYTVQVRVAMHSDRWNFGDELSPAALSWLAATQAPFLLDIYAYSGHDSDIEKLNTIQRPRPA